MLCCPIIITHPWHLVRAFIYDFFLFVGNIIRGMIVLIMQGGPELGKSWLCDMCLFILSNGTKNNQESNKRLTASRPAISLRNILKHDHQWFCFFLKSSFTLLFRNMLICINKSGWAGPHSSSKFSKFQLDSKYSTIK